jgi:hypothetical protein
MALGGLEHTNAPPRMVTTAVTGQKLPLHNDVGGAPPGATRLPHASHTIKRT